MAELERILAAYRELEARTPADNLALPELRRAMGNATRMQAKMLELLNRSDEARRSFLEAAAFFDRSSDAAQAADCRATVQNLDLHLAGDIDQRIKRSLEDLLSPEAARTPLVRASALIALVSSTSAAGDLFEASTHAETAAAILHEIGYHDPARNGLELVFDAWTAT